MILEISLVALAVLALVIVEMKDLLYAVIVLAGSDIVLALVFYLMAAPDIALTQAAVCAGLSTLIFMVAISKTRGVESEK